MKPNPLFALASFAFTLLPRPALAGEVWIVSPSGGGQFSQIQPAIDAAAEGDTVLVKAGNYLPFTLSKSLHVLAEPALQATILGTVAVRHLGVSSKPAVLTGLKIQGKPILPQSEAGLVVENNAAAVHLDRCWILGGASKEKASGDMGRAGNGVEILQSPSVLVSLCTIDGGVGRDSSGDIYADGGHGGNGIASRAASVALYHSTLRGGKGGHGLVKGGDAGSGYALLAGSLHAFGNSFLGGKGGNSTSADISQDGGNGGHGLLTVAGSVAHLLDNSSIGQPGGWSIGGFSGANGLPISGAGTVHSHLGIAPKLLAGPPPLRDGNAISLAVTGEPGDRVTLFVSRGPQFEWIAAWTGVAIPRLPALRTMDLGTIPATGSLNSSLFVPNSAVPHLSAMPLVLQAIATNPTTNRSVLTTPSSLVVLDHNIP